MVHALREQAAVLVEDADDVAPEDVAALNRLADAIRALPLAEEAPTTDAADEAIVDALMVRRTAGLATRPIRGERTVPLVDDVLALLPHLTGDEVAKVYDALPATAGAWEPHYAGPRRYSLSGTSYRALVSHDGNAWKAETWAGGYQATWHPTARAAQAACDARLEAAGVRLCGEVVRDG